MKAKDTPLLTIIVPAYNIVPYLSRCIHSITAQTYEHLEILLVDDGSTDGTGELCDKLAEEDSRIKVFHKENGGSSPYVSRFAKLECHWQGSGETFGCCQYNLQQKHHSK